MTHPIQANEVRLIQDMDERVALVSVRVGEVLIWLTIWRNPRTEKLHVFVPSVKSNLGGYMDAVELAPETQRQVKAQAVELLTARMQQVKKEVPQASLLAEISKSKDVR